MFRGRMGRETLGMALGVVGVIIFGGTLPATRLAVASLDPAFVTAGRAAIAGLCAAATLMILRRRVPARAQWKPILFGTVLLVGGFPLFSSLALRTAEASHGGVVLAILPLLTAAAATIVSGERPSRQFWIFALLGTGLVFAFVAIQSEGTWAIADALFLLAAISAGFGYAFSGTLSRTMPGWEVICWQLVAALPVTAAATLVLLPGVPNQGVPTSAWGGFAYVSLFSMFIGFFAWNAGLALGGVAKVGQAQLLQVFVTLALSSLILGERLAPTTYLFAALVALVVAAGRRSTVRVTAGGTSATAAPPFLKTESATRPLKDRK